MIGTKYFKPLQDNELPVKNEQGEVIGYEENPAPNTLNKYSEGAKWCNENDAHIEDRGDFYEIVKTEHPEPTAEEKAERIRSERDQKLNETQWMIDRHAEEKQMKQAKAITSTTLTEAEYAELVAYRQKLRNVPQQKGFPDSVAFPEKPSFVK